MVGTKTLLLGLGNDLLGDDAIGLRVAAALRERLAGHPEITIAQTTEMGLALLDHVAGFDHLVVVDATQTLKAPPGFVHEFAAGDLKTLPAVSPHLLGLNETLALGRTLAMPVPADVKFFAIEVSDPYTLRAQMTPELETALPQITNRIQTALLSEPH